MKAKNREDITDYGELLAYGLDAWLWSYKKYGDYQGDYIAILEKDSNILIYRGSYGSCSGCDWLQSTREEDFTEEAIKEYIHDTDLFISFAKTDIPDSYDDFVSILPANTRTKYEEDCSEDFGVSWKHVYEQIQERQNKNLDYLEWKSEQKEINR